MSDVLELAQGQSMDQALGGTGCVYFPLGAGLALHAITEEGAYSELALVGREGMLGISGFMGGGTFFSHAIVLKGGPILRISALDLRREVQNSQHMMMCTFRYMQALVTHIAQTGVCNRHHRHRLEFRAGTRGDLRPRPGRRRTRVLAVVGAA